MRLPPWQGLEPPIPEWHRIACADEWLATACGVRFQQARKPDTWTREEVLKFLSTLRHHDGRGTIRAFLVDLLADDIAEIVLAVLKEARAA